MTRSDDYGKIPVTVEFFLQWILTRIKERGWPKSEGLLRRRRVVPEGAIVAAMQDAVRVAIAIGAGLPDTARAIAITFQQSRQMTKKTDVEEWIDKTSEMGDEKMGALPDTHPKWLRLCSISATAGDETLHIPWSIADEKYNWDDPLVVKGLSQATALSGIAMAWSLRHPSEAQDLFHDSDAIDSFEREPEEIQDLVSARSIYSGWLHIAEELVSRYSSAVGLPRYEDLP